MSELKPCPFCGYEAECYESRGEFLKIYKISCSNVMCEARPVIKVAGLNEATESWNTRSLTPKQQCADEMYKALDNMAEDLEQSAFESWADKEFPSGDCETVDSKWRESIDYLEFLSEYECVFRLLAKARGEA